MGPPRACCPGAAAGHSVARPNRGTCTWKILTGPGRLSTKQNMKYLISILTYLLYVEMLIF